MKKQFFRWEMQSAFSRRKVGLVCLATILIGLPSMGLNASESTATAVVQNQTKTVTGVVNDATGISVIGANVVVKGLTIGTVTDIDGKFSLDVPHGAVLQISYIGYLTQEITVGSQSTFTVTLKEDSETLDEVVVVGYGTQRKENLTGAISQVKMDEALGDRPVTSVASALQGAVPGLSISGGTEPGGETKFSIRGVASINGSGSPLILIDNVPGDIDMLNPEDIESVSVLKDAASSAIYGSRAAFGVILITTKKGRKGERFNMKYNNSISFETTNNMLEQASVEGIITGMYDYRTDGKYYAQGQDLSKWLGYVNDYNSGQIQSKYPDSYFNPATGQLVRDGVSYYLKDNDPQGALLENFGFQHRHNVSASGGTEKVTYRASLGYYDKDGILVGDTDTQDRLNLSSYVKADLTDWLSTSIDFRYGNRSYSYNNRGVFDTSRPRYMPTEHVLSKDATTSDISQVPMYPTDAPLVYLENSVPTQWKSRNTRVFSQTVVKPFKGLEAVFEYTGDFSSGDKKSYSNNFLTTSLEQDFRPSSVTPVYEVKKTNTNYNAINLYATYSYTSLDQNHNIKGMAGFSQENRYFESLMVNRREMIMPDLPSIGGAVGMIESEDDYQDYSIRGAFFRANYNFQNKYLVEANGRYDGSSRFPTSNRFGFFPSASVGWQVGRESFMEDTKSWLDEFKLRASWGQIGNQDIDNYQYLSSMPSGLTDWIVGGQKVPGLEAPGLVSQNFTWEIAETLNLGSDFVFLNNRLRLTAEWYQRITRDMLAPGLDLSALVGTKAPLQNSADLRSRGWEIAFSWQDNINDNLGYNIGFNIYDTKTAITKYKNDSGLLQFEDDPVDGTLKNYYEGQELGEIWGYVNDGYYTINDFQDGWQDNRWALKEGVVGIRGNSGIRPGDVKFKDLDGNGEIYEDLNTLDRSGDRTVIGNTTPRFQYGVNLGMNYKGFSVSAFLNGTGKRDVWLGGILFPNAGGGYGTFFEHHMDYWKPTERGGYEAANPDAEFPRIYNQGNNGSNHRVQDKYLKSSAFLRLKNITVSYQLPKDIVNKVGLNTTRVFFSGENLFTIDNLPKGFDPERTNWGYPVMTQFSFGVSLGI